MMNIRNPMEKQHKFMEDQVIEMHRTMKLSTQFRKDIFNRRSLQAGQTFFDARGEIMEQSTKMP
jgi:hypothetical protein